MTGGEVFKLSLSSDKPIQFSHKSVVLKNSLLDSLKRLYFINVKFETLTYAVGSLMY